MLTGLLLAAAVASVATVAPPTATVLANRTAFNQPCVWFTSTAPDRLAAAASAALERLGWTVASSVGPRFTQEVALRGIAPAGALYVHSHGDHYYDAAAKRRSAVPRSAVVHSSTLLPFDSPCRAARRSSVAWRSDAWCSGSEW